MGSISRFELGRIRKDFNISFFFETGTFRGDGVAHAAGTSFEKILSVEIIPELAELASKRFKNESRVKIITSDSVTAFLQNLRMLKGNGLFWLDAHFPGADAGLTDYDKSGEEKTRLPLPVEIETIRKERESAMDVIVIDDLRIYEDGPYEKGNVPADAMPMGKRSIEFVADHFGKTHYLIRSYRDEGYLLVFPKRTYRRRHFNPAQILGRPVDLTDHYYSL